MKCKLCDKQAVIAKPLHYCSDHFTEYFESTVKETISRFSMITPGEKICVACSGGKDSTALLHVLRKLGYEVEAFAVDEGIAGYRDESLEHLRVYCEAQKIPLRTKSFQERFGKRIDGMSLDHPCSTCGVWRRKLLNEGAEGFSKLATGHNMDDEAQGVLMNLFRTQLPLLFRTGPITNLQPGLAVRIKPFYFLTEKEVATYAVLHQLNPDWNECPNARLGYRDAVRDWLNEQELKNPGTKKRLIEWFLVLKEDAPNEKNLVKQCSRCGSPSSGDVCRACQLTLVAA